MKDLKAIIKKMIVETLEEAPTDHHKLEKDEIGKFYVVTKPSKPKESIIHELDLMEFAKKIKSGELDESKIVCVYEKSGSAKTKSKELMDEIESELEELKTHMDEYRSKKAEIEEKKQKAKEIIKKYKK
jgi:hypothetical protein